MHDAKARHERTPVEIRKCEVGNLGPHGLTTVKIGLNRLDDSALVLNVPDYGGIDAEFISGLCDLCGVDRLRDCEGQYVMAEHESNGKVVALEPRPGDSGSRFHFEEWVEEAKKRSNRA